MTKQVQDLMLAVERVRDAFHAAVHRTRDLDAALALATDDAILVNLPVATGAEPGGLRRHLAEDVLPHLPSDLAFRRVSRTGDRWRVVDETLVSFTHDRELPWLLPGVAATHRAVEVLAISVVGVRRERVTGWRTLWDHAGLLAQLGLGPVPAGQRTSEAAPLSTS